MATSDPTIEPLQPEVAAPVSEDAPKEEAAAAEDRKGTGMGLDAKAAEWKGAPAKEGGSMNIWEKRALEREKKQQEETERKLAEAKKKAAEKKAKEAATRAAAAERVKAATSNEEEVNNQALTELPACPEGETPLHGHWSFWFDKRIKGSGQESNDAYRAHLKHLCCFKSVESFWKYYLHLVKPSCMPKDSNLQLFREAYYPMWENFPNGGCWILKVLKYEGATYTDQVWETLLKMSVGEMFEEPDMVGIALSIRTRCDMISIWNRNNADDSVRFRIGEKLKQLLVLSPTTVLEYKKHLTSIKDNSTFRNAVTYVAGMPSPMMAPANP